MVKLITVQHAKEEIKRLQYYIDLVEGHPANTAEEWIVKEYGYTNRMLEVVRRANACSLTINGKPIDKQFVKSVIDGKALNKLHRLLKSGYRRKVKPSKG